MFLNFTLKFYAWFNSARIFLFKVMLLRESYTSILTFTLTFCLKIAMWILMYTNPCITLLIWYYGQQGWMDFDIISRKSLTLSKHGNGVIGCNKTMGKS